MNGTNSGGSNRRLIGGLVLVIVIGLVIAALVSGSGSNLLSFLPFLLILACPLMMIFMMSSMGHNHMAGSDEQHGSASDDRPNLAGLSRDQQVQTLRGELTRMAWRQEALRHDLDQLEPEQVVDAENAAGAR